MSLRQKLANFIAGRESVSMGGVAIADWLKTDGCPIAGYTRLSDNPEVQTCVSVIADLVSDMTIHLMKNTDKGDIRITNELSRKIDINPTFGMTRKHFISWIVKTMLLEGNAIVFPKYTRDGLIENLLPVPRDRVLISDVDYQILIGQKPTKTDSLLHFVFNPDIDKPWKGRGFTIELRDVTTNLRQASKTKRDFLANQFMPSVIIGAAGLVGDLAVEQKREDIKERFGLKIQGGEPLVIPEGVFSVNQVKPLTLTDLAINDNVVLDKKTVAGLFGVPAYYLGVGDFNEREHNSFIRTRIMSIAMIIQQTLTQGLLLSPELYFRFNPRSLYSYSLTELATVGGNLSSRGIMTGNEVRDWIGLSPKDKLDDLTILENFIKLEDIGNQMKLLQEEK